MQNGVKHERCRHGKPGIHKRRLAAAVWAALVLLIDHTGCAQHDLSSNRDHLHRLRRLYADAPEHVFPVGPNDQVAGDRGTAIHQIVLIYDDACPPCEAAMEKLIATVHAHDQAVYLIVKHRKHMPAPQLRRLDIIRIPAVYIDGKYAEGWDYPGFLQPFIDDCGC